LTRCVPKLLSPTSKYPANGRLFSQKNRRRRDHPTNRQRQRERPETGNRHPETTTATARAKTPGLNSLLLAASGKPPPDRRTKKTTRANNLTKSKGPHESSVLVLFSFFLSQALYCRVVPSNSSFPSQLELALFRLQLQTPNVFKLLDR
jgi:hypothetical protein